MRPPDAKHREQAGRIRKAAECLNDRLAEILDRVKVEAGAMQVERSALAPRSLVEGVATFFRVAAAEENLVPATRIAADGPETVLGDELRVKQILNHLLPHAVALTVNAGVTIEVEREGSWVRLHALDTGPGLASHLHELIFECFRQADGRVAYQRGGTGPGLSLSRALAERMGGTVSVQSAVGAGSRFALSLPIGSGVNPA